MRTEEFVTVIIPRMVLKVPIKRVPDGGPDDLTLTEKTVFLHLLSRKSHKEIASALNIALNTVKFHASNIYRKCRVDGRLGFLAKYAGSLNTEATQPNARI